MWGDLLLQLAGTAASLIPGIGPVAAPLITGGSQGLASAFGISSGGGSSAQSPQGQQDLNTLKNIQQMDSYTSAGAEGAAANRQSAEKSLNIGTQTAQGRLEGQKVRSLADQALTGAQVGTDLATRLASQNLGNQRRDLMQQAAAAGGSPAALAGLASNIGQANTQALTNVAHQGFQATQAGIGQAGQLLSSAEQMRNADLQQRIADFQPFATQKAGGTTAGALGQLGQYSQTMAGTQAMEDPMALLKALGGQAATQRMQEPYENTTAARLKSLGAGKDAQSMALLAAYMRGKI